MKWLAGKMCIEMFSHYTRASSAVSNFAVLLSVLWIRIRIGSVFRSFLDPRMQI